MLSLTAQLSEAAAQPAGIVLSAGAGVLTAVVFRVRDRKSVV